MRTFLVAVLLASTTAAAGEAAGTDIPRPKPKAGALTFSDIGLVEFETPADAKWVIRWTLDGAAPTAKSYAYCSPLRVASTLKVTAACFGPDGKPGEPVVVECTRKPEAAAEGKAKLTGAINVDFSETPDLADWALRAQKVAEEQYTLMAERLRGDGFRPPRQVMLVFKDVKGIASTSGLTITCARSWIKAHPDDMGMVVHELAHVIQNYRGKGPGWLVEGIADYLRWYCYEPPERRARIDPTRAKYTNGYQDAAAFLAWIEKNGDKDIIAKMDKNVRAGTYADKLFQDFTGKDLDTLWKEFLASLSAK